MKSSDSWVKINLKSRNLILFNNTLSHFFTMEENLILGIIFCLQVSMELSELSGIMKATFEHVHKNMILRTYQTRWFTSQMMLFKREEKNMENTSKPTKLVIVNFKDTLIQLILTNDTIFRHKFLIKWRK